MVAIWCKLASDQDVFIFKVGLSKPQEIYQSDHSRRLKDILSPKRTRIARVRAQLTPQWSPTRN